MGIDPRLGNFGFSTQLDKIIPDIESLHIEDIGKEVLVESLCTAILKNILARQLRLDETIAEAVTEIRLQPSEFSAEEFCQRYSISGRTFERRFRADLGISPKLFMRITRAKAAIDLIKTGRYERLTDVAYALNYYDQSHFIRDLKHFTFLSPKGIGDLTLDFHKDLNGLAYI